STLALLGYDEQNSEGGRILKYSTPSSMMTLPPEFAEQISFFSTAFGKPSWRKAQLLLLAAILCPGSRTVCNLLRTVGLHQQKAFHKYHRFLSKAKWSARHLSVLLLKRLIDTFLDANEDLVFGLDETLERRWGHKIAKRGIYRDAVRSSASHFVKCSGLRWMSLMLLSQLPWLEAGGVPPSRCWALPVLTALCPSQGYYQQRSQPRAHKRLTDWARQLIGWLARHTRHLSRRVYLVGDGSYATYELLDYGRRSGVELIVRMRLDARLFAFPPRRRVKGRPGPAPKVGKRLLSMQKRLTDRRIKWHRVAFTSWYGGGSKQMLVSQGQGIWYKPGEPAVPLQWVLLKDPDGVLEPVLLGCTDLNLSFQQVVIYFLRRWQVEVSLEEVRRHLGVETQRQHSEMAIERSTPVLLALFSVVCLLANVLHEHEPLKPLTTAWYSKRHVSFSDALTQVRMRIWQHNDLTTSALDGQVGSSPPGYCWLYQMITAAA
ncbi:MAG: transposase, partial [Catalinimonas sp.]